MAAETLAFFGSDSRPLYKTNIFRALSLPKGYVLQYRYRRELIHGDLIVNLQALGTQSAVLYFATGNDLQIPEDQRQLVYHPIRHVKIKKVIDDRVIGVVHFFLEMGDFADAIPHPSTPAAKLSPKRLVTRITTQDVPGKNWADRVKGLRAHLPDQQFFQVVAVKKGGKTIDTVFSDPDRSSRYPLTEEIGYQIDRRECHFDLCYGYPWQSA